MSILVPSPGSDPRTYAGHSGMDWLRGPSWLGKPFYASAPGVVVRLSHNSKGGHWIVVRYDNTISDVGYAHMRSHAGCPRPGTRLKEGMRLGYVGDQGTNVTGPHIHTEVLANPTSAATWTIFDRNRVVGQGAPAGLGSAQRKAKTYVNRRSTPDTKHAPKGEGLKAGVVGNFTGWKHGEKVSGNDIWFRGISGDWFWSGGFTSTSTSGLKNLNPAPPAPKPPASKNPFGIADVRGLQKIAKLYDYSGGIDNIWGSGSATGFAKFLGNYGYQGNNVLGPNMWRAIAAWLRAKWGYRGNDVPGPVMRAALARAEAANRAQL